MENKDLRRSYNKSLKKYRFKKINRHSELYTLQFWDESMASLLWKNKFPEPSNYYFEIYPYKFHFLRCFGWFLSSLEFRLFKRRETTSQTKTATISGGVITVISGIIILIIWALFGNQMVEFFKNIFIN